MFVDGNCEVSLWVIFKFMSSEIGNIWVPNYLLSRSLLFTLSEDGELSTFNDHLGLAQVTALSLLVSEVAAHKHLPGI